MSAPYEKTPDAEPAAKAPAEEAAKTAPAADEVLEDEVFASGWTIKHRLCKKKPGQPGLRRYKVWVGPDKVLYYSEKRAKVAGFSGQ